MLKCRAALRTDPASPFEAKVLVAKHNHDPSLYKNLDKLRQITDKQRVINNLFNPKER
jgi:hypothetical protein